MPVVRIAISVCLMLVLATWAFSVRAESRFAALIVYALDDDAPYLLLASRAGAGNVWAGFTADTGWANVEDARISAIRHAVGASRCYFSFSALDGIVEVVYFRQPWESPARVVHFARVPKVDRLVLEDEGRDCPEADGVSNTRSRLGWVPWKALRADVDSASDIRGVQPLRLTSSARYFPGPNAEPSLLPEFAATLREMITESERKDSTIEFTLPW